jgi:hypothetical protein
MESQAKAEPVRRNKRRATDGNKNGGKVGAAASKNNKKYIESLFDEAYFAKVDPEGKIALDFYGEEAAIKEEELVCDQSKRIIVGFWGFSISSKAFVTLRAIYSDHVTNKLSILAIEIFFISKKQSILCWRC